MTISRRYHGSAYFRIKLRGRLENNWSDWFGKMAVSFNGCDTVLTGQIADQAALHGLLDRIRDLNLTLLAVERLEGDQENRD